jgi:hypothetical protein
MVDFTEAEDCLRAFRWAARNPWLTVRRCALVWAFLSFGPFGIWAATMWAHDTHWPLWASFLVAGPVLIGGPLALFYLIGVCLPAFEWALKKVWG